MARAMYEMKYKSYKGGRILKGQFYARSIAEAKDYARRVMIREYRDKDSLVSVKRLTKSQEERVNHG